MRIHKRDIYVERAKRLALDHGASLNLVATVDEAPWWADAVLSGLPKRWQAKFVEDTDVKLQQITESLQAAGIDATYKTLVGRAWMELIREVLRNKHDLVVKDVNSSSNNETVIRADMDLHVLRKCPCPVWLVKRKVTQFRRIAAAIDVVPGDEVRNAFNAKIINLASSIAEAEGCELHVVRAWSMYGESILKSHMSEEELVQAKDEKLQSLKQTVGEFLPSFTKDVASVHLHLPEGAPEEVLPAIVESEHEDLLVMGTIARTGVAGLIIGNTAEKILSRIHCSVLAIKPDDYVSPVTTS